MRKILKRALAQMGMEEVVETANGVEALRAAEENEYAFDLIMLDVNMPEMDGLEALREFRKRPECTKIPIIMCTSVAEKEQVLKAIKSGANNYVVKPFRPDDLKQKVQATLAKAQ